MNETTDKPNPWVAIFRGGKQTDSSGRSHDGSELLDKAVASFNTSEHEPPVVIGHPKENGPAWGWVSDLKRDGELLLAQFKDVQPAFADMVNQGLFKKRSASFYPDGRLRHVGFLGAVPPAVRGLPDVSFSEENPLTFDFSDKSDLEWRLDAIADWLTRLREHHIEKEGVESADQLYPSWTIDNLRRPLERSDRDGDFSDQPTMEANVADDTTTPAPDKSFTQQDMEEAVKQAEARFAETAKRERANREFMEEMRTEGRVTPAMEKAGLSDALNFLDGLADSAISFSDGASKPAGEVLRAVIREFPKQMDFSEAAGADSDPGTENTEQPTGVSANTI
ncbi:MAG: hypothetical protein HQL72_09130 [Magnetococcales bacterium]|nr:hypothetical protein [Magnetococcales bacterium]